MGCGAASQRRALADTAAVEGHKARGKNRPHVPLSRHHLVQMGAGGASEEPGTAVYCVRWSPCARYLLSSHRDGKLVLWNAADGRRLRYWAEHRGFALSCAYSPLGGLVASTCDDKTAKIWNVDSSASAALCTLTGHEHKVYSAEFSPDGRNLLTGSMDRLVKVWDVETQKCFGDLRGHEKSVFTCCCPRPDVAVSGGDDKVVRLWDWRTGKTTHQLAGHIKTVWSVRANEAGTEVLSSGMDCEVRDWDLATGRARVLEGHRAPVHVVAYLHDGQSVLSAGRDSQIRLWDRASGEVTERVTGHSAAVYGAAVSGDLVASCSLDETIRTWYVPAPAADSITPGCAPAAEDELDLDFDFHIADPDGSDPWGATSDRGAEDKAAQEEAS
eukprot:TRINITY_DN18156_c0_g1_i1.p1 TRINITY_DN18156_c0_g1~~TRINITY_DN18156_c0_g1_i1.p1  ORF type:complete len:386 (+),score=75.23 TRINITY_DN18156_c0_g1_i1:101-1258(+)